MASKSSPELESNPTLRSLIGVKFTKTLPFVIQTPELVRVFYCGAPALTKELRHLALDFSHKTTT
ncbi:hypothetical protein Godav_019377, partial [Gossypium davidsonii]|nr:hypothetical protein [Gossypium davidsonii]